MQSKGGFPNITLAFNLPIIGINPEYSYESHETKCLINVPNPPLHQANEGKHCNWSLHGFYSFNLREIRFFHTHFKWLYLEQKTSGLKIGPYTLLFFRNEL